MRKNGLRTSSNLAPLKGSNSESILNKKSANQSIQKTSKQLNKPKIGPINKTKGNNRSKKMNFDIF
jgi:hypothetical protein